MGTPYDEHQLATEARADIRMTIIATRGDIQDDLEQAAARLLRGVWATGLQHGVRPSDWHHTGANLPRACLEALVLVQGRENDR